MTATAARGQRRRPAADPERVRRVQELRRSNAAQPQGKRPTRTAAKRAAIRDGW